jgi:chorismate synthase
MKGNRWDSFLGFTTFGESHGKAIGIVIEDVKPGVDFPFQEMELALSCRKPGQSTFSSSRKENDKIEILSGIFEGKTTGMPICILVYNEDAKSPDYKQLENIFRPGHADYSLFQKFKIYDYRGGGRASGRETISRVIAGSFCNSILSPISIEFSTVQIGKFQAIPSHNSIDNEFYWKDESTYPQLLEYLTEIKENGNSVGGIVQVKIKNVSSGLGDPVFEKLDANIAKAILSIGGIKGIEFGDGFLLGSKLGSETNDQIDETGFLSNHQGGILGGISSGQDIVFRFVVKPTPSIAVPQKTIDKNGNEHTISIQGRHDVCIIPRIIPVVEAMLKLVLADAISYKKLINNEEKNLSELREAIDKIDEDILISLIRRQKISGQIGNWKKKNQIEITDSEREKELLKELEEKADLWGYPKEAIQKIWSEIISQSKKTQ